MLSFPGIDQAQGRIDVAEKPLTHAKLMPPPHTGVGKDQGGVYVTVILSLKPQTPYGPVVLGLGLPLGLVVCAVVGV